MRVALLPLIVVSLAACSNDHVAPERSPSAPAADSSRSAILTGAAAPGTIITLEPAAARDVPAPPGVVTIDQFGLQFTPALVAIRTGQRVEFRSSEDVLHNVRVDNAETKAPVFNVATPPFESYTHLFDSPGYYNVSCDVHPAMHANIFVATKPYVAVADDRGVFTVADLQPGSYRLETIGRDAPMVQTVEVKAPRTEITLTPR